ncbi:hypothetical protein PT274_03310 [Leuconostocaceae bacterium ESL0958]|nr:hypothetical protein [Leuconostocaceae bacterium ESL0958]
MENEALTAEIVALVTALIQKQGKTIYQLRVVNQRYTQQITFFLEWYQLGRATVSRQIKSVKRQRIADFEAFLSVLKAASPVAILLA